MAAGDESSDYAVVFRGDIVMGQSLEAVKQRMKRLFKADDARVERLFVGKPVALKKQLSRADAEKYKAVLHQAGALVTVEQQINKPSLVAKPSPPSSAESIWQLAPVGSQLSVDPHAQSSRERIFDEVQIAHLSVAPQEGNLVKDNEQPRLSEPPVDVELLDWELTPYGEALLKSAEFKESAPSSIDTSQLSLAEQGGHLLKDDERKTAEAKEIDTTHLSLFDGDLTGLSGESQSLKPQ